MLNKLPLPARQRSVLYVDMTYTAGMLKSRRLEEVFDSRHSNGYFRNVWGVHPMADLVGPKQSKLRVIRFSRRQVIIEGGVELLRWPGALRPLNFLISQARLLRVLVRLVRRNDISAIVSTDPFYSGLIGLALKVICRKPQVIYIQTDYDNYHAVAGPAYPGLFRSTFVEKRLAKMILSQADLVVGGSRAMLNYALKNGAKEHASAVVPVAKWISKGHLLDPAKRSGTDEVFKRLKIPPDRKYLLLISRLVPSKLPDDAVKAMKVAVEQDNSIVGLIAGDGPMREELEQLVASLGLSDNVVFMGVTDQETLSKIIPRCVTLSPVTGMALIECALGGSPAVAYNTDWQPDFITDGVNGFIAEYRDYEEMGRKALELLWDSQLRMTMSARIRQHALDYTDLDGLYRNEQQAFQEMFARIQS